MEQMVKELLTPILGNYQVTTQIMTTTTTDTLGTTVVAQDIAIPDYGYIAGAVMLCIFVFCLLRMVGGFLKCKL